MLLLPVQAWADTFATCVAALADEARRAGIASKVIESVLPNVEQLAVVLDNDAGQPEFTRTFAGYYPTRVSDRRVRRGRELLRQHEELLLKIQHDTGVPPQYLLAFWGLETNYGGYLGDHSVPSALATLACDSRRSEYFSAELLSALKVIERGDVAAADMRGSWAGAMGNMQFMPSNYLAHAVDADGDGKRDLWGSTPDALASAGRFLKSLGWEPGLRWGREVLLPDGFDYAVLGETAPLSRWSELGVTNTNGDPLPALDVPSRILLPAGHTGPAFMAYANFDVIMRWNRSEHYAITVGRLADRIVGAGRLAQRIPPGPKRWSLESIRMIQEQLNGLGHHAGEADGFFGPATRKALASFQAGAGLLADGYPSTQTTDALHAAANRSE